MFLCFLIFGFDNGIGHAIYYPLDERAPLGEKENIHDTAQCASRFVAIIAARLRSKEELRELAQHAKV